MLLVLLGGIATAFNYLILLYKLRRKYYKSFFFDLGSFILLNITFLGTLQGMVIAMVASFIISLLTLPRPSININFNIKSIEFNNNYKKVIGYAIGSLLIFIVISL